MTEETINSSSRRRESRIPGFYRLEVGERHAELRKRFGLTSEDLDVLRDGGRLGVGRADKMVENCVGVFGLPIGLGLNFHLNGRDYVIPMVVEYFFSSRRRHTRWYL